MGIKVGCATNLSGKTAIVTGSNTGIGLQTAKMLADAGAEVIMACRSIERAREAAKYASANGANKVTVMELDLSDTKSIEAFAEAFEMPGFTRESVDM